MMLQTGSGISYYFRTLKNKPVPSSILMSQMTCRFRKNVDQFIKEQDIEIVRFKKGQRKDDVTLEKLATHDGKEQVLYMGVAQEKSFVHRTITKQNHETGQSYPWLNKTSVMCNHYYFYIFDNDFGPMFIKYCSYFPYAVKVCLNGHEYLKRQLTKKNIEYESLDNGILSCENHKRMQQIANGLDEKKLEAVVKKWLTYLPSPFTEDDHEEGINYNISILQSEYSLTQVFDKLINGRKFFESVIRDNIDLGRPENVSLIFGRRVTKRTPGKFQTRIITKEVIPSLHVSYKSSKIKQYFKESKALRTETTINNARDFGIGKRLESLDKLKTLAFQANRRLLDVQTTQDSITGIEMFEQVILPVVKANQRVSGLKFGDKRSMALLKCLCIFSFLIHGFSNKKLRVKIASLLSIDETEYTANKMSYNLKRLRMRGIIEKTPKTNRYSVTKQGIRICVFFTRTYSHLFPNGLAQLVDEDNTYSKLNIAILKFDREIENELKKENLLK